MKEVEDIKKMVISAQEKWGEIKCSLNPLYPLSGILLCEKKEKLKNLLEDIRESIEALLSYSPIKIDDCRSALESIFKISEGLRASYAFPGYMESFYIMDTINLVKGLAKSKN
jgi:hypothetical protein